MFHPALELWKKGFSVIPLEYAGKKPSIAWKEFSERRPTLGEIRKWFGRETRQNIGLVCGRVSGLVALDADDINKARELYTRLPKTPMMTRTGKGVHFYYRVEGQIISPRVKVAGMQLDVRGEASYCVAPPSLH